MKMTAAEVQARRSPAGDGVPFYDWIVIGSGFGGSVAALRLAEKGYRVAVLERGRRYLRRGLRRERVGPEALSVVAGARPAGHLPDVRVQGRIRRQRLGRGRWQPRVGQHHVPGEARLLHASAVAGHGRLVAGARAALRHRRADARHGAGAARQRRPGAAARDGRALRRRRTRSRARRARSTSARRASPCRIRTSAARAPIAPAA